MRIEFTLNGQARALEVEPHELLIDVLRDRLQLTGTKRSCDVEVCGACTVLVAGRPVRPGRSSDGVLLLPLTKSRVGEEAPAFAVEIVYFEKSASWPDKGRGRVGLPAADLPANRSGLEIYHSPRFKLAAQPGAFRVQPLEPPSSAALREQVSYASQAGLLEHRPAAKAREEDKAGADLQALVDRFQKSGRVNRVAGTLPVQVAVPQVGRSLFLVSELTAEGQAPVIEFAYARVGK